jgi:hypothetical protein
VPCRGAVLGGAAGARRKSREHAVDPPVQGSGALGRDASPGKRRARTAEVVVIAPDTVPACRSRRPGGELVVADVELDFACGASYPSQRHGALTGAGGI